MEKNSIADYFIDEGEIGHLSYLSGELVREIDARLRDLQIVDELADSVLDAELITNCQHNNDIIIGMIYSGGCFDGVSFKEAFANSDCGRHRNASAASGLCRAVITQRTESSGGRDASAFRRTGA